MSWSNSAFNDVNDQDYDETKVLWVILASWVVFCVSFSWKLRITQNEFVGFRSLYFFFDGISPSRQRMNFFFKGAIINWIDPSRYFLETNLNAKCLFMTWQRLAFDYVNDCYHK